MQIDYKYNRDPIHPSRSLVPQRTSRRKRLQGLFSNKKNRRALLKQALLVGFKNYTTVEFYRSMLTLLLHILFCGQTDYTYEFAFTAAKVEI
jgi:hypothetical protein